MRRPQKKIYPNKEIKNHNISHKHIKLIKQKIYKNYNYKCVLFIQNIIIFISIEIIFI